eukprot:Blabericola_migrator_1__8477@NODE_441_length_8449_cov_49_535552_g346_i0_p2_GENE_NODE_441_length_8449_cov_49_535552_g346_i0NODE_441_length_8449_cov_49_535552_g346_i0_p2_ORF_typecomplete_len439_score89_26Methyltransf_16/PF10294_9/4_7e31Ank_2/PF12796_7/5_5e07Ank_2/PF12796_7/7_1e07Ank_5/PF13857_6/1_6e07Ank_5/PF13857_6/3_1e06Ank_5/PF13857_6/4_2e03Ank_4/PF13637_6/1_1e06Ank_4/PF13637_6/4e05Ank_3/PF13606_6/5_4e02Ank_3/PF13606_6/7_3e05Ank_3/PF13606_6/7e05Ank/PF00023_30/3_6e05Ank/PF00023_30/0_0022Ank/PF00
MSSSSNPSDDEWTLQHEFWFHCGSGNEEAARAILDLVQQRKVPDGFESELGPQGSPFPYTPEGMVNFKDEDGSTPVHAAAANNHCNILKLLLQDHGAQWTLNVRGNSPLHWAAQNDCLEATKWLLNNVKDIDVLQQNSFGKSSVSCGFESQNDQLVTALLLHNSADKLEKAEDENQEFVSLSEFDLLDLCEDAKQTDSCVVKLRELVTLKDLQAEDVFDVKARFDQTGCFIWESAVLCALWLQAMVTEDASVFSEKNILELGAGCGLPLLGLAARYRSMPPDQRPVKMTATDFAESTLNNLKKNVELNELEADVSVRTLDWLDPKTWPGKEELDVLVGSDLIYDSELVDGFIQFLHHALDNNEKARLYLTLEEHRAGVANLRRRLQSEFDIIRDETLCNETVSELLSKARRSPLHDETLYVPPTSSSYHKMSIKGRVL